MKIDLINPHAKTRRRGAERTLLLSFFLMLILISPAGMLYAQDTSDGFGFGDSADGGFGFSDSSAGGPFASGVSVTIGGEVKAELKSFFDDMKTADKLKNIQAGDIFSGKLNFDAAGSIAEGVIKLNLTPVFDGSSPVEIDEAYVRAFFGPVTVEGGLEKLTWGKADSFGPLDIVNPLDYTDLTKLSDPQSIKLARPMVHASWALGSFTKLEAVFVPWFQGDKFDTAGRWAPSQMKELVPELVGGIKTSILANFPEPPFTNDLTGLDAWKDDFDINDYYKDNNLTLKYAQAGMRFTTTIGSSDFGFQYYIGRLQRPGIVIGMDDFNTDLQGGISTGTITPNPEKIRIDIRYNYYHQIAADFARVIAGFNLRAEAGANITSDLDGKDGTVENPAFVWSLGFDRDVFWGINLNLQGTGKLRFFYDQIQDDPLVDCEAGTDLSSTRITGKISRKFFRDELELKATALWGIEDKDFLIMPAVNWSRNDVSAELSAGFFGGDKKGELGQYRDNGFVRLSLLYTF